MTEGFSLDPRARTVWSAIGAILAGGASLAIGVPLVALGAWELAVVALASAMALGIGWARLVWRAFRWADGDIALELRRGVVVQRASYVPVWRIQQIDVERGPIDRAAGLATLVVRTASATTDAKLPGLAEDDARRLRVRLLERAGVDDAV